MALSLRVVAFSGLRVAPPLSLDASLGPIITRRQALPPAPPSPPSFLPSLPPSLLPSQLLHQETARIPAAA